MWLPVSDKVHEGICLFTKRGEGDRWWGIIEPIDSDGSKEANVWFGDKAVEGRRPKAGEPIEYILFRTPAPGRSTIGAFKVWPKGERPQ